MKVAIYARFSPHPDQREESIEDQVRICEEFADKQGWSVTRTYSDPRVSGASILLRPAVQELLQDALAGQFDLVIIEDLDRLSRDQEDTAAVYKRLEFAGVKIVSLADGEVTDLHVGLKGTMASRYLKDLARKTHRGLRGRVEAGKSGGGNSYGYDVVHTINTKGETERGERRINEQEADVVRRIYEEYKAGRSPKAIAVRLNEEGIAGPSGKGWGPSTIYGNRERGTGILNNEIYIGRLVWNRLRYIKDPDTGKRVSRLNDESDWIVKEVPDLRIVDQNLWDAVKEKQGKINKHSTALWQKNRPRNLFSFLLKCGVCGGGYSMISQTHLGCSNSRNKGTCDNRLCMHREKLEAAVLETLRDYLMDEKLCAEFCREYTAHVNALRMRHNASLESYKRELAKLEREREKLVQSILDGVPGSVLKDKGIFIEQRQAELEEILASTEEAPVLFHPNMAQRYHQEVRQLIRSLNEKDHRQEAAELLRSLIDRIVLTPTAEKDRLTVDLIGDLAGILSVATNGDRSLVESGLSWIQPDKQEALVAGTCNTRFLSNQQDVLVAGARNRLNLLFDAPGL